MANAIEVVADMLAIVRERDNYKTHWEAATDDAMNAERERLSAVAERDALRAERDRAIEERDLARRGFDLQRETIESFRAALGSLPLVGQHLADAARAVVEERDAILAKLEEAQAALKVVREWNDFERNGLREMRDQVRALVGGDENKPVVDAVRAVVDDRNAIRAELDRAKALYAACTNELSNLRSRIVEHETAARSVGARAERERLRTLAADVTAPEDAMAFVEDLKRGDL